MVTKQQAIDFFEKMNDIIDIDDMEFYLEQYEQSKWVEFNHENELTWPEPGACIVTNIGFAKFSKVFSRFLKNGRPVDTITNWQSLPAFSDTE